MQVFCVLSGLISQEQEIHLSSNLRVEGLRVSKSISISSGFVSRKEDSRVWMMWITCEDEKKNVYYASFTHVLSASASRQSTRF